MPTGPVPGSVTVLAGAGPVPSSPVSANPPAATAADSDHRHGPALDSLKLKGLKYVGVSVVNVLFGQALLFVFARVLKVNDDTVAEATRVMRGAIANTLAVLISSVPAYYMSRAWVWGKRGKSELRREILPFWIFVFMGWLFSTVGVALAVHYFPAPLDAPFYNFNKLLVNAASIVAFGVLWVVRFFWMDKAFHLDHHHAHGPLDVLLDEDEPVEPDPV